MWGNPLRGMLLERFRGTGGFSETRKRDPGGGPRALPGATRTAPAHRLPASFILFFIGANTEPRGSSATREAPFGGPLQLEARAPHPAWSPTSQSGTGATAAAHGRKDPQELAEAGDRTLQGAGREENPGVRAQATESQARSRSGAPGDVRALEQSAGWSWGCCGWGWSRRLGPELGRDRRTGRTPGLTWLPRVALTSLHPCSRRVVFWLPRLLNAS